MRNGQRAWCKEQRVSIADFGLWISDWMSTGRRVSIADFGLRPGGALGPYAPEGLWILDWMSRGQRVSIADFGLDEQGAEGFDCESLIPHIPLARMHHVYRAQSKFFF